MKRLVSHRLTNLLQSVLLLGTLILLVCFIGWLFAGKTGIIVAFIAGIIPLVINIAVLPDLTLRMYGARRLEAGEAPLLFEIVAELSRRAAVVPLPRIHYIPSEAPLIFTTGSGEKGAVAISDGALRLFTVRELIGVLAHELSHLDAHDSWVMSIADILSRATHSLSIIGQFLIILNLPLYFYTNRPLPWLPLALMALAPTVSGLIQLALSRTREYDADLNAVRLCGDASGLASALAKLESYFARVRRINFPGMAWRDPSLLRTHPASEERIRRLRQYQEEIGHGMPASIGPLDDFLELPASLAVRQGLPRRRFTGLWH
jgi:heat shock protein HtpX